MTTHWFNHLKHPAIVFAHDVFAIPLALGLAYWLRFNFQLIPEPVRQQMFYLLPWLMVCQGFLFWFVGLYRGLWRFASMRDVGRIIKAVFIGTVITILTLFLVNRLEGLPRSLLPIYAGLLIGIVGGSRFLYRWLSEGRWSELSDNRVLIVGAGKGAESILRHVLRDPSHDYSPVAIVDDNPALLGKEIHGVRVLGRRQDIPALVKSECIERIIIAMPDADAVLMRSTIEICERCGVPVSTLPSIVELMTAGPEGIDVATRLRDVSLDDLLGRDAISLDFAAIRQRISGNSVLVSGGGGSIGSEVCNQLARLKPARLIVIDACELNLYQLQGRLVADYPELLLDIRLVDVSDKTAVESVFKEFQPQLVFHAAAFKHVPMLEFQIRTAVKNNVLGTRVMADAASHYRAESFVLISTDKAVNPTNIMGMTKRVAEVYCQYMNARSKTHYMTVRFGNVLGSTGSVVPLFKKQIEAGGPVTVTHPDITRYFMTIPEAAQLILQAATLGKGGEIFVLDMGEPIKIAYLAEMMIRLAGKIPERDIPIVYTGLRAGEKLYEELFHEHERLLETSCRKIFRANCRAHEPESIQGIIEQLEDACLAHDEPRLCGLLIRLVPEFKSPQAEHMANNVVAFNPSGRQVH